MRPSLVLPTLCDCIGIQLNHVPAKRAGFNEAQDESVPIAAWDFKTAHSH